ncbi:MAG: 30S ribosome-binding factor RbfA [Nitrospirae bacterium]|nr:30S ribosome-binding factor RbfA [Nitrospirota bacterium]
MHPYKRSVRIGDLIKEEAAYIITQKLDNPKLGFVTVTGAEVSDDLRHATIFISVLDDSRRGTVLDILSSSSSFIKSELAKKIRMRFLPKIHFKIDSGVEHGKRIDKLLSGVKHEESGEDKG